MKFRITTKNKKVSGDLNESKKSFSINHKIQHKRLKEQNDIYF